MDRRGVKRALAGILVGGVVAGCVTTTPSLGGLAKGPSASAKLLPTKGNRASGSVTFTQQGDKVVVKASVTGLKPNAEHGFHVHEKGDCTADAMSAGGHFNPGGAPHGTAASGAHHAGDLPNLKADASGVATLTWEETDFTVTDGPASVVGRSVVVHLDQDDYKSQPAGSSGPRIACGVIARN